ncbi:MAG: hydroxyacylglutathione hydrolase [Pseudomonadota bacterium]|uniref:hydroxyacylglutathione hydrolase n=1 Tax=Gallaecimonas pentaromativorans TaxID=584787 RepID=UPI00067E828B|nr:hydroxyacylglutathione hydrolase [Gallaecimonas pentaromativorans]MED5524213.1 hydroxyacylglutathione hydrolase [Pseudomonadota bacterium]
MNKPLPHQDPVFAISAFKDNYIWAIETGPGKVAVVDPGDAAPVLDALAERQLTLSAILITHHHSDHTGGIRALLEKFAVPVFGPANKAIDGISHPVSEGDQVQLQRLSPLQVISVPGHTLDHIAYHGQGMLFCGDTLFSAGCGRLFEGDAPTMYHSLAKLAALKDETRVYCAHEYTQANLRFAWKIEPANQALKTYMEDVAERRQHNLPTLPSTIAKEKAINPFLRAQEIAVKDAAEAYAKAPCPTAVDVFAALRRFKDES